MPIDNHVAPVLVRTAAALTTAVVLAISSPCAAGTFAGKVVTVTDGDTVIVRDHHGRRHEVRLAGIDAPEIRQPYGVRSRSHLAEVLYGRQVTVAWYKRDRYDRVLGRVTATVAEPCGQALCTRRVDAAYAQIAAGLAWHDREHLDEQGAEERLRYARAERDARSRQAGLWAESAPMPPWRYRHLHPRRLSERWPQR